MNQMIQWCTVQEQRVFNWINQKWHHQVLDFIMSRITHLGGASFTITCSLLLALFVPNPWGMIGWQCLIALTASHLPVAFIKKIFPRRRPYLVLTQTNICKNPLVDHSFPSGHTTAIFSFITPIVISFPQLGMGLILLACCVGLSRIYLGLHYPSDVLIGGIIGICFGIITVSLF